MSLAALAARLRVRHEIRVHLFAACARYWQAKRSGVFFAKAKKFGACAEKQCGRVLDPVGARLPPVPPAFRKPFVHEHRLEVAHRNCWFTIDLFGIGFVGKKSE